MAKVLFVLILVMGIVGCGNAAEQFDLVVMDNNAKFTKIGTYGAKVCKQAMEALAFSEKTHKVFCLGRG